MKLMDLYFGYKMVELNGELSTKNLFGSMRVLHSIAMYRTNPNMDLLTDPFEFCFGDTRSRCEYEFQVCQWPCLDDSNPTLTKVDVYTMYAKPNKDYLMSLVESVSINSCREFLKKYNRGIKK